MDHVRNCLKLRFPDITYRPSGSCQWSPRSREIYFIDTDKPTSVWALLHETGHAVLEHTQFVTDIQLLQLEIAAWQQASMLATEFDVIINGDHVEDCLDTYRDWLYARSTCPVCSTTALQNMQGQYSCFNCHHAWRVGRARFCRAYRSSNALPQTIQVTF